MSVQMNSTSDDDREPDQLLHYGIERIVIGVNNEEVLRSPYLRRLFCITKRSSFPVTSRQLQNR